MKTTKSYRAVAMTLCAVLMFIIVPLHQAKAETVSAMSGLISFVNSSIDTSKGRIEVTRHQIEEYVFAHKEGLLAESNQSNLTVSSLTESIYSLVQSANADASAGKSVIMPDGRTVSFPRDFSTRGNDIKEEFFWWGVRRTYLTDAAALAYVAELRRARNASEVIESITRYIHPAAHVLAKLNTWYAKTLGDSIEWAAKQPGNGVVVEMTYVLTYTAVPRK
ncbi:hypothetical protein [Alloscardovia macacae]|uniref:Uncharacterized protein n=1 Tax=Alloscardovia macacae TaxID=1160091 RepID=A0A261F760_9BIFI|nr:hypothetical protein [Alloscardovia macacae]OZG54873.1 hypothetical protein ALMA_0198 [Alloscardovia macacae]